MLSTFSTGGNAYGIDDRGDGPAIVLYPSLGRAGSDFDELAASLNAAGFRTISVTPPGFVTPPVKSPGWSDLFVIAGELWEIVDHLKIEQPIVVGHAFGNRVVRTFSTLRPEAVSKLILLACGGEVPPDESVHETFFRIFDSARSEDERALDVKAVFFAPANEIGDWRFGWDGHLALHQSAAVGATDRSSFYLGGSAPGLIIQGLDDLIAPPVNSRNLASQRPDTTLVNLENCGHAMLPEQPDRIREEILTFLSPLLAG